jgi:hypothetical protein
MTPDQIQTCLGMIHTHYPIIMITGGIAYILGYVQFGEAFRLAYRDKIHAIPLFVVLFYLANDITYELHYHRWFVELHDPFFENAWYMNFPYAFLELFLGFQVVHYGRAEVFPGFTALQSYLTFGALLIAMVIFYQWLGTALDDYFNQIGNMLTLIGSNMGLYLLIRRGSARGQSLILAGVLIVCAGALQFFGLFPLLDPRFQTPAYFALATMMSVIGLLYFYLLWRRKNPITA